MTQLLVSVRSAAEAEAALAGGASLIDVKEPARGSLGRASDAVIAAVLRQVAGRCTVSAALGELGQHPRVASTRGLAFVKWGLSGLAKHSDWRRRWEALFRRTEKAIAPCRLVTVAYADWPLCDAPPLAELTAFVCGRPGSVLLVDTFHKQAGQTLLDWMSAERIADLCQSCKKCNVQVALAGSLGRREVEALLLVRPSWFAVRGAVCSGRDRAASVQQAKVSEFADLLAGVVTSANLEDSWR